jgi:hypothetical protein
LREKTEENITAKYITEKYITGSVSRGTSDNRYIGEVRMESRAFHVKHFCGQTMKAENEVIRRYDYWKIRGM